MTIDDPITDRASGEASASTRRHAGSASTGPRTAPVLRLVFAREIRTRARSGAFIVTTVLTLLLIVAVIVVPTLFGGSTPSYRFGWVGQDSEPIIDTAAALARGEAAGPVDIATVQYTDVAIARRGLDRGTVDAVVIDAREVLLPTAGGFGGSSIEGLLQRAAATRQVENLVGAQRAGEVVAALTSDPLQVSVLSGQQGGEGENEGRAWIAYGGLVLTYMIILTYGVWTLTGVTEEKSNRVMELLLAAARPWQLLAGKILGISVLGLSQFVLTVAAAVIAVRATGAYDLPALPIDTIAVLILWVVLGFALYMVLYGAAGALASKTEDAQTASTPISLLTVGSFFLSFVVLDAPDGLAGVIGTFVPFSAPFVVPIRYAFDALPLWQHLVAMAVCAVTTAVLLRLAGRVYAGGVLQFGGRLKWREAFRRAEQ